MSLINNTFLFSAIDQFDLCISPYWFGGASNIILYFWAIETTLWSFYFYVFYDQGLFRDTRLWTSFIIITEEILDKIRILTYESLNLNKEVYFLTFFSLFFIISIINVIGILPFSVTLTSYLVITLFFSLTIFIHNIFLGFRVYGLEFFSALIPSGTPVALKWFIVFVETVSFVARLLSLAIRLFANIVAGHALLKVLTGFAWIFLGSFTPSALVGLFLLWSVVLSVTILEFCLAFLQAYVFVLLSTIYLNEAVIIAH